MNDGFRRHWINANLGEMLFSDWIRIITIRCYDVLYSIGILIVVRHTRLVCDYVYVIADLFLFAFDLISIAWLQICNEVFG